MRQNKRETEYQRAWRERGEAETAMHQWRHNQSSPVVVKIVATIGGLLGAAMLCAFISDPDWQIAPMLFFAALFYAMPFLCSSMLDDEAQARREARETLARLKIASPERTTHDPQG